VLFVISSEEQSITNAPFTFSLQGVYRAL